MRKQAAGVLLITTCANGAAATTADNHLLVHGIAAIVSIWVPQPSLVDGGMAGDRSRALWEQ